MHFFLDCSVRIWKLKYIKQYCQLCYMIVKHGLLPEANICPKEESEWGMELAPLKGTSSIL